VTACCPNPNRREGIINPRPKSRASSGRKIPRGQGERWREGTDAFLSVSKGDRDCKLKTRMENEDPLEPNSAVRKGKELMAISRKTERAKATRKAES